MEHIHSTKIGKEEIKLSLPGLKLKTVISLSVIIALFMLYFKMPVLSLRFVGWAGSLFIVLIPLALNPRTFKAVKFIFVLLFLFIVLGGILSSPLFNAKRYRKMIGEVKVTEFTELISPINLEQVPIVDRSFAAALAEKKLGEDFALGSRVSLGWPTRQMVKGKLYWVIPLMHSGFFKWLTNVSEGTPGYIMVSAINPQDIRFVREVNGRALKLKYQQSSFFNQKLHRHLYLNGFVTKGLGDYTFEVDESGEPYWTVTVYNHRIGIAAPDGIGLAIVHAESGEIKYYPMPQKDGALDDSAVPEWVDRIQPAEFVLSQLDWWGNYVRGYWNTVFGKRDMLMVTEGYNIIYGNDNRNYFYTGMSSIGSDEGTVGFVLTDTRSKQTHLYKMSGATEYAAMRSAEGKVQNFKYRATFPILLNMNGVPTYFMTLKDSAGLVKMFAFVSVKDFSLAGVGENIKSARDDYQMLLAGSRIGSMTEGASEQKQSTVTVARIGSDVKDARTYFYITTTEQPKRVFVATSNLSSFLPLTRSGDTIQISYVESGENEVSLITFKNISVGE